MSLSLDLMLFIRNSKTKLGLSTSVRYLAVVLSYRIGSNQNTWISPDALAMETGIKRQNIYSPIQCLVDSGLVKKTENKKDKRKSLYSFTDVIKNYTQMNDNQKRKAHLLLNDEYEESVDNLKTKSGKPDKQNRVMSGKPDKDMSGKPDKDYISKNAQTPATSTFTGYEKSPKVPVESSIKAKVPVDERLELIDKFYPNHENQKLCDAVACNCGTKGVWLIHKFKELTKRSRPMESDLDKLFRSFLDRELPSRKKSGNIQQVSSYL